MKIQKIRFQNLNSLSGEWEIDLTHPDYLSGIFAITGPTGAGKTTILDAISLALYGQTPRLEKVNQGTNEIMSKKTVECFSEVTFETPTGRYRCHFSQYRGRKKITGNLQPAFHELVNDITGEVLENKTTLVAKKIVEVIGMDFDRFTRSILLAQGQFASFLKAEADEKAELLEQITGTSIYSEISRFVHQQTRKEEEQYKTLNAKSEGIEILTPEDEKALQSEIAKQEEKATHLNEDLQKDEKAKAWLETIQTIQVELKVIENKAREQKQEEEAFVEKKALLARAKLASTLDLPYQKLTDKRKQLQNDEVALQNLAESLSRLKKEVDEKNKALSECTEKKRLAKEALEKEEEVIKAVRDLDRQIFNKKETYDKEAKSYQSFEKNLKEHQTRQNDFVTQKKEAEKNLAEAKNYLLESEDDQILKTELSGWVQQIQNLKEQEKAIQNLKVQKKKEDKALKDKTKALVATQNAYQNQEKEQKALKEKIAQEKEAFVTFLAGKSFSEYRNEKDHLQVARAYQIQFDSLEKHRQALEDGKACPLCGALHHPYREGQVPVFDDLEGKIDQITQRIKAGEAKEAFLKQLEDQEQQGRDVLNQAKEKETQATHEEDLARKDLKATSEKLQSEEKMFEDRWQDLLSQMIALKIEKPSLLTIEETLRERLKTYLEKSELVEKAEQTVSELEGKITELEAAIQTQQTTLFQKKVEVDQTKEELKTIRSERKTRYGEKDPDEEENRFKGALDLATQNEEKAKESLQKTHDQHLALETRQTSLKESKERLLKEIKPLEEDFVFSLKEKGFENENLYQAARLSEKEQLALEEKAQKLKENQKAIEVSFQEKKERLEKEEAKKITDQSLDVLTQVVSEKEDALKKLIEATGVLKGKWQKNEEAKKRLADVLKEIEGQKIERDRWKDLNDLIGSHDGKNYRNFAQSLTFEIVVQYANVQLQKMTDRYLLVSDNALNLNVMDAYQASEIRSSKNLSGGESFLVSLALALGLSKMASHNVPVDSLFLDEGFGTLDEEALNSALETLASLKEEGKLIGVISHVAALKERIGTQIQVIPQNSGKSQLMGPGCKKI